MSGSSGMLNLIARKGHNCTNHYDWQSLRNVFELEQNYSFQMLETPLDLYERPIDTGVAQFVGDANLIVGQLRAGVAVTNLGSLTVMEGTPVMEGAVTVLVRPEQIALSRTRNDAAVEVAILESDFHGHDSVYRVSFMTNGEEHVLTVRLQSSERFAVGDVAHLRVTGPVNVWQSK